MMHYYRLSNHIKKLHVTPNGGWVQCRNNGKIPIASIKTHLLSESKPPPNIFWVDSKAMDILKLCNGTRDAKAIASQISQQSPGSDNELQGNVIRYLVKAKNAKILQLSSMIEKKDIVVTGSSAINLPVYVTLEINNTCNFRCTYCYLGKISNRKFQNTFFEKPDGVMSALTLLSNQGIGVLAISGGEPFLHSHIREIVRYCRDNYSLCCIQTNGSCISQELIEEIANAGNIYICMSLDGPSEEVAVRVNRTKEGFKRTIQSLELLSKHHVAVRVGMTIVPENEKYIEDTLLLAQSYGACAFVASPIAQIGNAKTIPLSYKNYVKYCDTLRQMKQKYPDFVQATNISLGDKNIRKCSAGNDRFVIDSQGNLRACALDIHNWTNFGNVFEDAWEEILKGDKCFSFKDVPVPNKDICKNCENYWYCNNCIMLAMHIAHENPHKCIWASHEKVMPWIKLKKTVKKASNEYTSIQ